MIPAMWKLIQVIPVGARSLGVVRCRDYDSRGVYVYQVPGLAVDMAPAGGACPKTWQVLVE